MLTKADFNIKDEDIISGMIRTSGGRVARRVPGTQRRFRVIVYDEYSNKKKAKQIQEEEFRFYKPFSVNGEIVRNESGVLFVVSLEEERKINFEIYYDKNVT